MPPADARHCFAFQPGPPGRPRRPFPQGQPAATDKPPERPAAPESFKGHPRHHGRAQVGLNKGARASADAAGRS